MFYIKVAFTVDSPSQTGTIVGELPIGLEVDNSNNLLIKLTSPIMQTVEWADVGLVNFVMPDYLWIRHVGPVISPEGTFVRGPACESMHQYNREVIRPLRLRKMVVASIFEA